MTGEAGWHPVALAADVEPMTSAGTRLFGRELVVWRDEAGEAHVWEDRCPHRGMRLSFGFVRGTHIACLYHGWQFDTGGRCRYIPAHPQLDVPATITVERYASAERLGIVWVFSGDPAQAGAPPGGNSAATGVRSLAVDAPLDGVVAALRASASPFGAGDPVETGHEGPLLTLLAGRETLYAALQPVAADRTTVHLSVAGEPDGSALKRLSLWGEVLRRHAEAQAAEAAA